MPAPRSQDTPFVGFTELDRGAVPVPARFFTDVLPEITSAEEFWVTLSMFRLLAEREGYETPVAERTLLSDRSLRHAFRVDGTPSADTRQAILDALHRAVARGTLLRVKTSSGRQEMYWYFLHTAVTRELVNAIQRGAIAPPKSIWLDDDSAPRVTADPPTPFYLYEQNIGPLTPLIADRITRAMDDYPLEWIEDAIEEAVAYNRRSWRYIERILETWSEQGRQDRSS